MSFSAEQKREIIMQAPKALCCKRAFLSGVLLTRSTLDGGNIYVTLENTEQSDFIASLVYEIYAKEATRISQKNGGRRSVIAFFSPAAERFLTSGMPFGQLPGKQCKSCGGEFIRGLFFASGKVSDPDKQYSLEFSPNANFNALFEYLRGLGLSPKIASRGEKEVIYFRQSTEIEDFFAFAAMNHTIFELMNAKINSEIRNNANRVANCETNNIGKAVDASAKQSEAIGELIEANLLSSLPEELERTARLRHKYPDLSLSQLAALHSPPISKPGLSHRLKKIMDFAQQMLRHK